MGTVEGRCPRCGAFVSEQSRFCRECLLQLAPGDDLAAGQTELMRQAWAREHPEAAAAYERWVAGPEGPPPGITDPVVKPSDTRPPLEPWQPLDGRLRAVVIAFGALIAFDLASIASGLMEISLLDRVLDGQTVTDAELENNDLRVGLFALVQAVIYVTVIVLWLRWFHRAYRNVGALPGGVRRHGIGWAVGGWFVPILSLIRPKEIANDLWASGARHDEPAKAPALLLVWWLGFLVTNVFGQVAFRQLDDDTVQGLIKADKWYVASDAVDVIVAFLAIKVATVLTRRMEARHAEAVSPPAPAAALPA
jgi:hypothetical protein